MATNPGTQPWGTLALIHQQEIHMTFGYGAVGTRSEPLRPGFNSKKCHDPCSLSHRLQAHRHTTHTGHYAGLCTGTLGWSRNNLPSQFAVVHLTTNKGNSDPFNWLMKLRLPGR